MINLSMFYINVYLLAMTFAYLNLGSLHLHLHIPAYHFQVGQSINSHQFKSIQIKFNNATYQIKIHKRNHTKQDQTWIRISLITYLSRPSSKCPGWCHWAAPTRPRNEMTCTPRKFNGWNPKTEIRKMIFLLKDVIFRCYISFRGSKCRLCHIHLAISVPYHELKRGTRRMRKKDDGTGTGTTTRKSK